MTLARNYAVLPDGYGDTLVMCETLGEIMSDKLISLAATTKYIRYRDLWDLPWLLQKGASYDVDLIRRKIQDYRIPDYKELLARRLQSIDTISVKVVSTMKCAASCHNRFLTERWDARNLSAT